MWFRDGEPPPKERRIETVWRNPATPTIAAQVDAVTKLVQTGILPADSDVALEMAGLTEDQRRRVTIERQRTAGAAAGSQLMDRLAQISDQSAQLPAAAEVTGGGAGLG